MHQDMKDRHRWRAEEDALLGAYVKQFGPREWHLVSQRMNTALGRDAKSCLERWKNYLKPGIKKGSLTEEEQQLVIRLQAKHGNKWKKIAAEVPGRTAKRLGKWWEVFKEKQERDKKESNKAKEPLEEGKYDQILETFAEKLVKERPAPTLFMATNNFMRTDPPVPSPNLFLPWLSTTNGTTTLVRPPHSPSVSLSLSPSTVAPPPIPWLQREREPNNTFLSGSLHPHAIIPGGTENMVIYELAECCRELEEGHRAWAAHKKEAEWRLRRVELQLESEKACRRREKVQEIESKMKALREEEKVTLDRIEVEYRDQLAGLKRDAEAKEQTLVEQWAAKHSRLNTFIEQMVFRPRLSEPNGR